jgi:signal transduction histidine kinase
VGALEASGGGAGAHGLGSAWTPVPSRIVQPGQALYRVAQEALHNAAKHARAREVVVVLEVGPDVGLLVADDGRGFDPRRDSQDISGCNHARARGRGGRQLGSSAPGNGTRLRARIPPVLMPEGRKGPVLP